MSNTISNPAARPPPAPPLNPEGVETVAVRLSKYRRILRLENTLAATLLAGITLYTAVKFTSAVTRLSLIAGGIFFTLIFAIVIFLALSRGSIEWQADLLDRNLPSNSQGSSAAAPLQPTTLSMSDQMQDVFSKTGDANISVGWPRLERGYRSIALFLMLVAGFVLLFNVWLPLIDF